MTSPVVLCLGEILFDLIADQLGRELAEVESWTAYPGGAPANVACALVKLGTAAGFIGCVGQDETGDELVTLLKTIGVDTTGVQRHPTAPTRQVYVTRSLSGDRNFAGFGETPTTEFADTRLEAEQLPDALFAGADYLVTGTLELAYPQSQQAIFRGIELAKQHQVKVFVDLNWRPVFWQNLEEAVPLVQKILEQADLIKCSDDEAQLFFKTDNPVEIAQKLGVRGVLVSAGERGCTYSLGDYSGEIPAFKIEVVETTGAGDSFVAGFLHQCVKKGEKVFQSLEAAKNAVTYASVVGALTTTKPGAIAAQPTAREVEAFLGLR